jgi:hypothetical protein
MRPAALTLREDSPGVFHVLWKTPMVGDARLALNPEFSGADNARSGAETHVRKGAAIDEWTLKTPSLRGQTLRIRGLEGTMTDTFVQIFFADGTEWSEQLTPRRPLAVVGEQTTVSMPFTSRSSENYSPYLGIAGWGAMCIFAEVARRERQRGRYLVVGTAYALGFLSCAYVFHAIIVLL